MNQATRIFDSLESLVAPTPVIDDLTVAPTLPMTNSPGEIQLGINVGNNSTKISGHSNLIMGNSKQVTSRVSTLKENASDVLNAPIDGAIGFTIGDTAYCLGEGEEHFQLVENAQGKLLHAKEIVLGSIALALRSGRFYTDVLRVFSEDGEFKLVAYIGVTAPKKSMADKFKSVLTGTHQLGISDSIIIDVELKAVTVQVEGTPTARTAVTHLRRTGSRVKGVINLDIGFGDLQIGCREVIRNAWVQEPYVLRQEGFIRIAKALKENQGWFEICGDRDPNHYQLRRVIEGFQFEGVQETKTKIKKGKKEGEFRSTFSPQYSGTKPEFGTPGNTQTLDLSKDLPRIFNEYAKHVESLVQSKINDWASKLSGDVAVIISGGGAESTALMNNPYFQSLKPINGEFTVAGVRLDSMQYSDSVCLLPFIKASAQKLKDEQMAAVAKTEAN